MFLDALRYHICLDCKNNSQAIFLWTFNVKYKLSVGLLSANKNFAGISSRSNTLNTTTITILIQPERWCISKNYGNKNTLTGPANCKKTTRHHTHLSLCAKSRKTNDAKSRKWPKTSIWAIFWRFRGQISPNCKFFWKIGLIQIEGHI